jgi:signal transduction histidine kinase
MSVLSSLSNRIFLASALLAVLSIAAAVFVVNRTVTRGAEADLERSLKEAGTLVEQFQSLLFEHLVREARLIADLPKLKAAVSTDHPPTVQPLADDYAQQIDADMFLVTNPNGALLAVVGDPGVPADRIASVEAIRHAIHGQETVTFWPRPEGPLQVVSVPIVIEGARTEILGTLSAGVSLDQRLATRIKALTHSEVVFASGGTIQASTLADGYRPVLMGALAQEGVSHIVLGNEEFLAVRRSLGLDRRLPGAASVSNPFTPGSAGADLSAAPVHASADAPVALILRSRTEHLRFLRTLHSALAFTALVAVLVATLFSYFVARTITSPLGALTATMREMAATGDLTRVSPPPPVSPRRWEDEDARVLAGTFRTLTESLSRFQREAGQRERLSSLGRLSTVVAHEVRNPLMIIKGSLRTLRRDTGHVPEAAAAITDIEEEVARLNSLVNEVLDYARPIRFDLATVSLNALCRDAVAAATAATAGQPAPPIAVRIDPAVGDIVTDPERLRLVLVNVLTNARDAVLTRARGGTPASASGGATIASGETVGNAGSAPGVADRAARGGRAWTGASVPDVELRTERIGTDVLRIRVSDRGQGVPPEHLAHIFDPFFTTKRTGSGLGLAIAKNIVEGLGGVIAVTSEPERGTDVQITLPRTPPPAAEQAPRSA